MPQVEVVELIPARIDLVWDVVTDVEAYPRFMDQVKGISVLEREGNSSLVSWEVELKGSILCWTEREHRDNAAYTIDFQQVDGDLEVFEGNWQLSEDAKGDTVATLTVSFEIGIPMLRTMLDPIAARAIETNSRKMLTSIGVSASAEP